MKNKRLTLLLLVSSIVGCKMPTNEQVDPLQPGIYLAKNGDVTSRLVIDDTTITWTGDISSSSTAAADLTVYSYTKHKTVAMDFDHIYTHTPDGVKLPGGNLTKRYYGLQLKPTPVGAGAFYHLHNPKGTAGINKDYIILANYSSKGIIDSLVVRPSGILMANTYMELDKYRSPQYNFLGVSPGTATPARPINITLHLDGAKADFVYKATPSGSEQSSPLQNKNWVKQQE